MDSAEQFLVARGYGKHPPYHNDTAKSLYQLQIRTDEGKRFINVWEYDMRRYYDAHSYSYTVEQTFETKLDRLSFKGEFYNLNADQVKTLLPRLEEKMHELFNLCQGEYQ